MNGGEKQTVGSVNYKVELTLIDGYLLQIWANGVMFARHEPEFQKHILPRTVKTP